MHAHTSSHSHGRSHGALHLTGVGVGPGDPRLLTYAAVDAIGAAHVVFAAASSKNDHSIAEEIARPHMREDATVQRLPFPMTRDASDLHAAWRANADTVAGTLANLAAAHGGQAHVGEARGVFLTLGDPLIYSTFGYIARTLAAYHPEVGVDAIPGITSYQAAAAKTGTILVEAGQSLTVMSGVEAEALRPHLGSADSAVILKAYRDFPAIRRVLAELGRDGDAVLVSRIGHHDEAVHKDLATAPNNPPYLSLVLSPAGPAFPTEDAES